MSYAITKSNQQVKRDFEIHAEDSSVSVATTDVGFLSAVKSINSYVIYHRLEKPNINTSLERLGYKKLKGLSGFAIHVNVLEDGSVAIAQDFPEDIRAILSNRAQLFSRATGRRDLSLVFGDPKNENYHEHIGAVMTGSLLQRGTEWPKPMGHTGKVEKGDDFFIGPMKKHRSPIIEPDENPEDGIRLMWAIQSRVKNITKAPTVKEKLQGFWASIRPTPNHLD